MESNLANGMSVGQLLQVVRTTGDYNLKVKAVTRVNELISKNKEAVLSPEDLDTLKSLCHRSDPLGQNASSALETYAVNLAGNKKATMDDLVNALNFGIAIDSRLVVLQEVSDRLDRGEKISKDHTAVFVKLERVSDFRPLASSVIAKGREMLGLKSDAATSAFRRGPNAFGGHIRRPRHPKTRGKRRTRQ